MRSLDALAERLLDLAGDSDARSQAAQIRAFEIFLLMHMTTRLWLWVPPWDGIPSILRVVLSCVVTGCFLTVWSERHARTAVSIAATCLLIKLVFTFPKASNHALLETLSMILLATLHTRRDEERALFLEGIRWMTAIVFFSSGLQKVLHGTYFDAQYFGVSIAIDPSFAAFFRFLVPENEFARLAAMPPVHEGAGPYSMSSPLVVLLSNAVYLSELLVPVLLLHRRTRQLAAVATIAFATVLQLGAREVLFGALFVNLLLLFPQREWNRKLLPFFAVLYAFLLGARYLFLPELDFN